MESGGSTNGQEGRRDILLFRLHQEILEIEQRLFRGLHVDESRRDTSLP